MRKLPAMLTVLALSACCLAAQKTIIERCKAPSGPFYNQPIPEQLKIPDAAKTARQVSCFTSFKKDSTMLDVVKKCGLPDKHAGSGVYIFVYYMNDCSTVTVSTPDLKRLAISHVRHGKTTTLVDNWR